MNNLFDETLINKEETKSIKDRFIIRKLTEEESNELYKNVEEIYHFTDKAKLPKIYSVLQIVSTALVLIMYFVILSIIKEENTKITLELVFNKASVPCIILAVSLILMIGLSRYQRKYNEKILKSKETEDVLKKVEASINNAKSSLGIDPNIVGTTVLFKLLTLKKGRALPISNSYYETCEYTFFTDEDNLYIGNAEVLLSIKKAYFKDVIKHSENVVIDSWNKEIELTDESIKPYIVKVNKKTGAVTINCFYEFIIDDGEEELNFYIAGYDGDRILDLLDVERGL